MQGFNAYRFAIMAIVAVIPMISPSDQQRASAQSKARREGRAPIVHTVPPFIEPALPPEDRAYASIDGKHLYDYVVEQVGISRRYRDQGHPQFWGRIIGTSSDAESAQWLLDKFEKAGLVKTHIQPINLLPQWMAKSWDASVTASGKSISLSSAQPAYYTLGTKGSELDLPVVYVGMGTEAEFAGRDVRGKAVFVSSMPRPGPSAAQAGALQRAEKKGAAVIFDISGLPGNFKVQSYPVNTTVPTFNLGMQDGQAIRTMIEQSPADEPPHVKVRLDVEMVPNLKTALVWGTLPGATDETVYVIAHRDGWFDAAGDNAGGVAAMLGLVEFYAKVPQSHRRRTMVFIGTDGHHNTGPDGGAGREWLVAHRNEFFTKTALMVNCEHPSDIETYVVGGTVGYTNTYVPQQWYAGGASRPKLTEMAAEILREFGVTLWDQPSPQPPGGDLGRFYWFLPGVATSSNEFFFFHTDANTPETVPWTGLQATTRAYAKIIDEVNKIDLSELIRPAPADPRPPLTNPSE